MIKACLFDLYGILVSDTKCTSGTMADLGGIDNALGNKTLDILATPVRGMPGVDNAGNRERLQETAASFSDYETRQLPDRILPGALDFVKDLYRHGIRLASTSTDCKSKEVLSSVGLYGMFDHIVEPKGVAARPAPEALLEAVNRLGLKPEECVAFEHTLEGIEAARAAGIRCVAVGDLTRLYAADMGVANLEGLTLMKLKDSLEVHPDC